MSLDTRTVLIAGKQIPLTDLMGKGIVKYPVAAAATALATVVLAGPTIAGVVAGAAKSITKKTPEKLPISPETAVSEIKPVETVPKIIEEAAKEAVSSKNIVNTISQKVPDIKSVIQAAVSPTTTTKKISPVPSKTIEGVAVSTANSIIPKISSEIQPNVLWPILGIGLLILLFLKGGKNA